MSDPGTSVPVPVVPLPVSSPPPPPPSVSPAPPAPSSPDEIQARLARALERIEVLENDNDVLREKMADLLRERGDAKAKLKTLEERDHRLTEFLNAWDRLRGIVKMPGSASQPVVSAAALGKWLERAGKRNACRRMLETLIEHREITRSQLGTLSIVSVRGSSFRNSMAWLKKNGLISVKGDQVRLVCP